MPVDTRTAPRRELRFQSFEDILADIERVQSAVDAGRASTTGNWSVGENADHCARFIRAACDGFESKAPGVVRLIARALYFKKAMGDDPIPPGFKLPRQASALMPEAGISDSEGLDHLRKEVKRVLAGKEMTHPSPLFGPLSHRQWVIVQCKHCALHLSYIHLGA
jgi:hypothetical protein